MAIADHLILGGNGFIGRHVALALARSGRSVVLAARQPPHSLPVDVEPGLVHYVPFDLERADWTTLVQGHSVIHHYAWSSIPATAALDPVNDLNINVRSTLGLLEAMRRHGGQRLLFASSGGTIYGRLGRKLARENDLARPMSTYGVGKLAAEHYIRVYRLNHGVDGRIARLSNPFGAGQDARRSFGAISNFMKKALSGEPIQIWGNGEIVRDYVYVWDVVRALVALADVHVQDDEAPLFNVASGEGVSLNELVVVLSRLVGHELEVQYSSARRFDVPYNVLDASDAYRLLGWKSELTLEEGMRRMLSDLQNGETQYATCPSGR